ncbi:MAG: hypothetical protein V4706_02750 [Pseudomonadota bacterium]
MTTFVIIGGGGCSAAMLLWLLSQENVTVLEEIPKEAGRIEFFSSGEKFECTDGRRFWPVTLTPTEKPPRIPQQGKPVAQWKQERKGWRK